MQPKTMVHFDVNTFNRLKSTVSAISKGARNRKLDSSFALEIPLDIGIELTNRCNLKCKHCFLWNDNGLYSQSKDIIFSDIEIEIIENILRDTHIKQSKFFFWGTEPLAYRYWDQLCQLLVNDPRWTVVCTNGTLIENKIDSILSISKNLALVISLEGFEYEHDAIRGKGTYSKLMENIRLILELQKKEFYQGTVTIHCVLNDELVDHLFDFCKFVEQLNVDSLYLGFPWYINEKSGQKMDDYFQNNLSFISKDFDKLHFINGQKVLKSWHTYNYRLSTSKINILKSEMKKINKELWNIRLRFQPAVENSEIELYVCGTEMPMQNKKECLAVSSRIDIRSNGLVTACQPFPELIMGDLHTQSLIDIWQGEKYKKMRKTISEGLSPVCSRCVLLYLNGK